MSDWIKCTPETMPPLDEMFFLLIKHPDKNKTPYVTIGMLTNDQEKDRKKIYRRCWEVLEMQAPGDFYWLLDGHVIKTHGQQDATERILTINVMSILGNDWEIYE